MGVGKVGAYGSRLFLVFWLIGSSVVKCYCFYAIAQSLYSRDSK